MSGSHIVIASLLDMESYLRVSGSEDAEHYRLRIRNELLRLPTEVSPACDQLVGQAKVAEAVWLHSAEPGLSIKTALIEVLAATMEVRRGN